MKNRDNNNLISRGEIVIYKTKDGVPGLAVKMEKDNIWLTQAQIATLFGVERSAITKHLRNIFNNGELDEKRNVQKMHIPNSDKLVKFYNLDVIISVGYRVNSGRATQFRIWATRTLKEHLVRGYTINEKRLKEGRDLKLDELEKTVHFLQGIVNTQQLKTVEALGLLKVITDYTNSWIILQKYDEGQLEMIKRGRVINVLDYHFSKKEITELKNKLMAEKQASDIFGQEREHGLEAIINNLEQTFGGKNLYSTIEERASHLLYFVIKDHPFVDGNKRIGSFLFILFLLKNNYLYNQKGEKKINDNALASLALLVAASNPKDKEIMVSLVTNLLIN